MLYFEREEIPPDPAIYLFEAFVFLDGIHCNLVVLYAVVFVAFVLMYRVDGV